MVGMYRIVQNQLGAFYYVTNMWAFKAMAISNMITGSLLLVIGGVYMFRGDIESSASWLIFGTMYLVMDQYSMAGTNIHPREKTLFSKCFQMEVNSMIKVRMLFCAVSPILAVAFLAYILA